MGAGAFGAHGLREHLDARSLEVWETGARYLMYAGLALLAAGAGRRLGPAAGWALLAGAAVFSGTLFGLGLGGPRWLGAITPIGGVLLIVGFLLLAVTALRG